MKVDFFTNLTWLTTFLVGATAASAADNWPPPDVDSFAWIDPPQKAALMVVAAHPDDEGIFFGGAIPYYAKVRKLPTVLISATNGDGGQNHLTSNPADIVGPNWGTSNLRVDELREAAWIYGLRSEPIISPAAADQFQVNDLVPFIVRQIRTLRPDVILTHDPVNGEYGHRDHINTGLSVIAAYAQAADPNVVVLDDEGNALEPWEAKKLYIHLHDENQIVHSWETKYDELGGKSSRDVANDGLAAHRTQRVDYWQWETDLGGNDGKPGEPTLAGGGVRWDGRENGIWSSNRWGLHSHAEGFADNVNGDFFAGIDTDMYAPEPGSALIFVVAGLGLITRRCRRTY